MEKFFLKFLIFGDQEFWFNNPNQLVEVVVDETNLMFGLRPPH